MTKFLRIESQLKQSNPWDFLYLQIKFKTRLKFWMWGLNFVSDLAQVEEVKYIASCNIFSCRLINQSNICLGNFCFVINTGSTFKLDGKSLFEGAQATYLIVNICLLYTYTVVRKNA